MISVVCFLWRTPGYRFAYTAEQVNVLRRMVARNYPEPHRFLCVTDMPQGLDDGIEVIPLWDDYKDLPNVSFGAAGPSCYRRLKVFSEWFGEIAGKRFVCIDLDVVITGDLRPLWNRGEDFIALRDPARLWPFNGSMFMQRAGSKSFIWDEFDPATSPQQAHAAGCQGSDQGWLSYRLGKEGATWDQSDGVLSFRVDLKRGSRPLPKNAKVVFFHGKPKPWDVMNIGWVRDNYC